MSQSNRDAMTPAELFGPLLSEVQERDILSDGKQFVDAIPRRPVEAILTDFASFVGDNSALLKFVSDNFDLPPPAPPAHPTTAAVPLREHIRKMWRALARDPQIGTANASALPVRHQHVVPGGRFREIYYWDSYFTMLGLVRDGEIELATGIVEAMTDLIEEYGYVPNGARTYFLGRSQPPLYHLMVGLLEDQPADVADRRQLAMKREHAWWMAGAEMLAPGTQTNRVAMLADGSILNRYWDPRPMPRDESWREDLETAASSGRPPEQVYRDLRAGAESGWDFSSRWLDELSLPSIRTTSILPVDLNAFLYGLEMAIASAGDVDAEAFAARAEARRDAIHKHLWASQQGHFCDFDLNSQSIRLEPTAAALAPLFTGCASQVQADATARFVEAKMLAPGGLHTTQITSGQQWDRPNGWAPLQWIGIAGLRRYGHGKLARTIAIRWVDMVDAVYAQTGLIFEKYDIETCTVGTGGEYANQIGFGWTNGVTAVLLDSLAKGYE